MSWRPPRQALIPHPEQFQQLQLIGRWAAKGMTDQQIADRCNAQGWLTATNKCIGPKRRFLTEPENGELVFAHERSGGRPFGKDSIRGILVRHFPREFAPGSDHGTILTPSGDRVEGQHRAAFTWELWHRIDELRATRRGSLGQNRAHRPWPLSAIAICAACSERLRVDSTGPYEAVRTPGLVGRRYAFYRDTARRRGLPCPSGGAGRIRATDLEDAAVNLLLAHPIPPDWREQVAAVADQLGNTTDWSAIERKRTSLQRELERVKFQHRHGLVEDEELVRESDRIRQALGQLPRPDEVRENQRTSVNAGELLVEFASYWRIATLEERVEMFRLMLVPSGLRIDLTTGRIVGVRPRRDFFPILSVMLRTGYWLENDEGWLLHIEDPTLTKQSIEGRTEKTS